jgi:hypothetical protein
MREGSRRSVIGVPTNPDGEVEYSDGRPEVSPLERR